MMRMRWEAWCYRCRARDGGEEPDEAGCLARISDFKVDHQASCGVGVSVGHQMGPAPGLTGDGQAR